MYTNLSQLLTRAASTAPDKVALIDTGPAQGASGAQLEDTRVTWAELDRLVDAVSLGVAAHGVRGGQRVLIALGNRLEFAAAYLGVLRAGAVAVPVNPRSAVGEFQRMAADSGARLGITDAHTIAAVREAIATAPPEFSAIPTVVVIDAPAATGEIAWPDFVNHQGKAVPLPAEPESLAVLLYTSGTSGRPRSAMLTHRALLANIEQVAAVEPPAFTEDDVSVALLPLFHVYGLNAVLGQFLRHGHTLVVTPGFDPEATLALIERYQVSVLPVAPPVLAHWRSRSDLRERLSSVRLMMSGSAPLSAEAMSDFVARTGIVVHQGYGLTEAAPVVTSTLCSQTWQPGSVGSPLPGVEIELRDDDGSVEGEDPGEIYVRGANIFSGYWPDGSDGPDADGYFATGDVGIIDADGNLFLVDRLKELIIVNGFNVYPSEIEEVVAEVPGVAAVAIIGVDDEHTGEAVTAYVVPTGDLPAKDLARLVDEHCAERLARFKRPTQVNIVDELPYGITGKVQKGRLRATARREDTPLVEGP